MAGQASGPVVCLSYLALAELWTVQRFPSANYGAEVLSIQRSVAADAPMAAAVLTALDVSTLLLSNDIGDDTSGNEVREWLQRYRVETTVGTTLGRPTPQIAVVADDQGTRTWFPHLPGVADALAAVDLSPLERASFAYIDCYQLIEAPAVRAIHAARAAGVPLLLNLGGSPLSAAVVAAVRAYPHLIIQTNTDDADASKAPDLAASFLAVTDATWVVITAGAAGAVAVNAAQQIAVPAFRVVVRHTHCAGAAFSGGLLYGLLHDWPMEDCLDLACASGALRCERAHHEPMPTFDELQAVIGSRERAAAPAA
jgi:sugar/nucleoside kinase (ribokinase family)